MNIYPSSKAAYKYFGNSEYRERPYITIGLNKDKFRDGSTATIKVTALAGSDFSLTITGSDDGSVSATSFNTAIDYYNDPIWSLAEALKKNISLFYDVKVDEADVYNDSTVTAYFDSSSNYKVAVSDNLTISGYPDGNYVPLVKYVMTFNVNDGDETTTFDAEKYTNDKQVFFNLTSPFVNTIAKYPISFTYSMHRSFDGATGITYTKSVLTGNDTTTIIMPTTCGEFYELDYKNNYLIDVNTSLKGKFLTNKLTREIAYDERIALSALTSDPTQFTFKMHYYTPSGNFITTLSETDFANYGAFAYYSETHNYRTDIYVDPCIQSVENKLGKTVGYVEAVITNLSGTEKTDRLRLNVNGRCQSVNTVYFVNKIGGIDWYTFKGSTELESDIDDQEVYSSLYKGRIHNDKTYHQTNVRYKTMEKKRTLNSGRITHSEAKWLDELASSHYVFLTQGDKTSGLNFYEVVVDEVDVDIDSSETYSECSITYYIGDKDIL